MALPQNLNTNEVKSAGGVELEMARAGVLPANPNSVRFVYAGGAPSLPISCYVAHRESGSGITAVRNSIVNFERTIVGHVDTTKTVKIRGYTVLINPIGQLTSLAPTLEVMANLNSFMASLGVTTTILYDGTGSGTAALTAGTL